MLGGQPAMTWRERCVNKHSRKRVFDMVFWFWEFLVFFLGGCVLCSTLFFSGFSLFSFFSFFSFFFFLFFFSFFSFFSPFFLFFFSFFSFFFAFFSFFFIFFFFFTFFLAYYLCLETRHVDSQATFSDAQNAFTWLHPTSTGGIFDRSGIIITLRSGGWR